MEDNGILIPLELTMVKVGAMVQLESREGGDLVRVEEVIVSSKVSDPDKPYVTLVFDGAYPVTGYPRDRVLVRMTFS